MVFVNSRKSRFDIGTSDSDILSKMKRRKVSADMHLPLDIVFGENEAPLPALRLSDYFMEPSLKELAASEDMEPGYCSRVRDFTVGRFGYGSVKFLGETDVRWLKIDEIVKFGRHGIAVYGDESGEPAVGQVLNKPSVVTLVLQVRSQSLEEKRLNEFVKKLRNVTERQGAHFISFDSLNGEWKFSVNHFSRFGLTEEDEDSMLIDDAALIEYSEEMENNDTSEVDDRDLMYSAGDDLSHSLPTHLGLDPSKMQEMRMLMFPAEEAEEYDGPFSQEKQSFRKESARPLLEYSALKTRHKNSPPTVRKTPLALLGYNSDPTPPETIFMTSQNKGMPPKVTKVDGFRLDLTCETPVTGHHSKNVVDAALFMGRSFGVGWGPNGVLVHAGATVGKTDSWKGLSSVITVEKVALDKVVRDEYNDVNEELIDLCFVSPLKLHKSMNHKTTEAEVGPFRLPLQKLVSSCFTLPQICRNYIEIVERQLDVTSLRISDRTRVTHQVMVWELIKVLFSERDISGSRKANAADEEETMDDKESLSEIDLEALPLVRRAEFSYWLQESVCHRVQNEISCLNESNGLEHIFLLLTGRQLDTAVELAASRGDVRLSCLLSQAGGSMVNRADVARQLHLWRINGLDFNFMENDRLKLYELLAGNIHGALGDSKLDWKRYLGLLMWYELSPDTPLFEIIHRYEQLLHEGGPPYPVPIYVDEGADEYEVDWSVGDRYDLAYYLMLLHADKDKGFKVLKTMFSAYSSTHDALDYHMIWHQRAILEAIGTFTSNDLHVLDMSLVSQLLSLGLCQWAIYVVLQMPYREDFPYLQTNLIREILFQYCENWSTEEMQSQFIAELGVPSAWMNEALAVYCYYHGDLLKALEHFLKSYNWQRAHSIFMTSVAHSLFLSAEHSEIWRLASSMEEHKEEIADWDLGAGIYISFYELRRALQDPDSLAELDSLECNNRACREFFSRLNESLAVWESRLPVDARASYSNMAEEICHLLQSNGGDSPSDVWLSYFNTIDKAPLPEDLRSCHLQKVVSHFTYFLAETAP